MKKATEGKILRETCPVVKRQHYTVGVFGVGFALDFIL
jgi:sensor histidine kinase regulating citrate/malate metabolism